MTDSWGATRGHRYYHRGMKKTTRIALTLTLLSVMLLHCVAAIAGQAEAVAFLKGRQGADGGFAEPDAQSDGVTTCWALLAGTAAGEDAGAWTKGGRTPVEYLKAQADAIDALEEMELFTLALSEAGQEAASVGGKDLVALINAQVGDDGRIGGNAREHCLGLTALRAAGEDPPPGSTTWLVEHQRADGAWGESDEVVIEDTALALEALVACDAAEDAVTARAVEFLKGKMAADGGFPNASGTSDAVVTATVMRAIKALGQDPSSQQWSFQGNTPAAFLGGLQASDGHYQRSRGVDAQPALTTAVALPAAAGEFFPLGTESASARAGPGVRDLGTMGAGLVSSGLPYQAQTAPAATETASASSAEASAEARTSGSIGALWLFLVMCGVYALTLIAAAAIAGGIYGS